jgi:hypothetical protein
MQLNYHYYSRKKEINEAKELSFGIVRNIIGVVAFMTFLVLSTLFSCVFNIRGDNPGNYRLQLYLIAGLIIASYMYYAKKRIKPLFSDIEVIDKDLYIKNNYHIYLAIIMGLYGGAMFGIATLIGINCRD